MEKRMVEGGDSLWQDIQNPALEAFTCSVCLELVYKPVVHACGHMFCFWCTFQAMDNEKQSQCPMCRQSYLHFPRPCQLLHLVLTKAASKEYKRRGHEIQCKEEEQQFFSPCLSKLSENSQIWKGVTGFKPEGQVMVCSPVDVLNAEGSVNINVNRGIIETSQIKDSECEQRESSERNYLTSMQVLSVDDFRCVACRGLLHRPVVLNCGDVFCEICLDRTNSKPLRCPSCRALHPGGSVHMCMVLHHYLEAMFPAEYVGRHQPSSEENNTPIDYITVGVEGSMIGEPHEGVGCDGCGMYPIIGDRYRCEDCLEAIGFDLCGICYITGGDSRGRFNQNHLADHHMKQIKLS